MSKGAKVYGCNHVAIEVDDVEKAVAFCQVWLLPYQEVQKAGIKSG
jgi:hypothetical protein